jgi:hypothetical protein
MFHVRVSQICSTFILCIEINGNEIPLLEIFVIFPFCVVHIEYDFYFIFDNYFIARNAEE